jgi:hypothetical protein
MTITAIAAPLASCFQAALHYAALGLAVIPLYGVNETSGCDCGTRDCPSPGKHPATAHGLKDASRDDERILGWWDGKMDCNVGVATGQVSGVIVLDVDGVDGAASLATLGPLPPTWRSATGRGEHLWFRHPGGVIPNFVKRLPGLDLRGDGGYVVAPPSRHHTGRQYEWIVSPENTALADVPARLLELMQPAHLPQQRRLAVADRIAQGSRNDTLYRQARSLKAKGFGRSAIAAALHAENQDRCDPPLLASEIEGIVQHAVTQADHPLFIASPAAVEAGDAQSATGDRPPLPEIVVTDRELRDLTSEAMDALLLNNNPPTLFQRGGALTRIRHSEQGAPFLELLTESALRGMMTRTANWRRLTRSGPVPVDPPINVVRDVLALPGWPRIPVLDGIVEAPTFSSSGTLLTQPGYDETGRLWFHAPPGLVIPGVPENPTPEQVVAARDLLHNELLGDFPFVDEAARANALAAMLLPFARELCGDLTPLHLIDAPTPGTGKGLLADMLTIPATGRSAEIMAEGRDDEEWRKRITAILIKAPGFILIDNLRRRLDSSSLAAALTAGHWTDRILGQSKAVTLPVRAVWLATGNNVGLSNEMGRRSVWIRLDSRVDYSVDSDWLPASAAPSVGTREPWSPDSRLPDSHPSVAGGRTAARRRKSRFVRGVGHDDRRHPERGRRSRFPWQRSRVVRPSGRGGPDVAGLCTCVVGRPPAAGGGDRRAVQSRRKAEPAARRARRRRRTVTAHATRKGPRPDA